MKIIRCTPDNTVETAKFYDKVVEYLDNNINYPRWTRGSYPSERSVASAINAGEQYAVTENGRILGAFILNTDPQGDYSRGIWSRELADGDYFVIHTLAVDPEEYGKGIAGKIIDYCISSASEQGLKAIRLDVVPDNTPARRLYERKGFSFAGEMDLGRGIDFIPTFALYELNIPNA